MSRALDDSLVYEILSVVGEIPMGRVASYGQIAWLIGRLPSWTPMRNTASHSRPLAAWNEARVTPRSSGACLAAARGTGVRVHAWLFCFNATRPTAAQRAAFEKKGWYLKDPSGKKLTYLDPSNPDLRWTLLRAAEELARSYPVAGVHLDFVRWYERPAFAQATPEVWKRFRAERKSTSGKVFAEWRTAKISRMFSARS